VLPSLLVSFVFAFADAFDSTIPEESQSRGRRRYNWLGEKLRLKEFHYHQHEKRLQQSWKIARENEKEEILTL
jgi:hypothetical protein